MKVILAEPVVQKLRTLDKSERRIIGAEIRRFQNDLPVDIKKLKNADNQWRLRAGNWRIVMERQYDRDGKFYFAVNILRRKDAYRH